ncbi:cardiolipin synthase ClsB [Agrilutibacter solisilvae]|uniref:Cardiolipin synthase B n=1 Tax=Agrilutibacter solisilvae TaxID=2763317 RepID=A0A974Y0Z6_9GAMM|nr:cardiolipin synthase ClsB [Lysobacter solisilvae]QSX79258.1 cardiolipin synthase ClsB [Lysobacter solisilvae]
MKRPSDGDFQWRAGNRVELLENGEAFFARAFQAIAGARHEVMVETFILFEDKVGKRLHGLLIEAAQRGVQVDVLVDGYGSPHFSDGYLAALTDAGVRLRAFDPQRPVLGMRLHIFRRMHRKLLVVDGELAFVGGINYSADHLADFGPEAKQDYAVELRGPIVADIRSFAKTALASRGTGEPWRAAQTPEAVPAAGDAQVMFALRDNRRHRSTIEREYRRAIRSARREVIIANAYFFPGYWFLRDLRRAARRGVKVTLLFQGEPDMPVVLVAARALYRHMVDAGINLHEYCEKPFHGKVALVDDDWATVGSSNLDPLSLALNLEANVFVRDEAFVRELRARLQVLLTNHCRTVDPAQVPRRRWWQWLTRPLLFHVLRHFPSWAGWLPAHAPRTALLQPAGDAGATADGAEKPG